MEEESYERALQVDLNALDVEWMEQPRRYDRWGKRKAKASAEKFRAEENLKLVRTDIKRGLDEVRAEVEIEIREHPEKYFPSKPDKPVKPTEGAIQSKLILHDKVKEKQDQNRETLVAAIEKCADAIEEEDVMETARIAMQHKKTSLEYASMLWAANYYARPNIPDEALKRAGEAGVEEHKKKLGENFRLRRRQEE